ncbi:MAG: TonB C-terminal domain-containing protein [Deltaproteobacteria bacterium]|nr:TonB C-terminal domain-containing protein [Deltaproteobacteria bacterium]MBW2394442.1 TonB C-terminal domain-containing protein [Deltaproteobacteria bacterium]
MIEGFVVRRRPRRQHPMHTRRIGGIGGMGALAGAGAAGEEIVFPGSEMPEPQGGKRSWLSGVISLLGHGLLIALLLFLASRIVEEEEVPVLDFVPIEEVVSEEEPAPAPQVLAESMSNFAPAPMAMAPQIVNTAVIQNMSQKTQAVEINTAAVVPTAAPVEISQRAVSVDQVGKIASVVSATVAPVVTNYQGPALAGPIQHQAPTGIVSGPRQVISSGNTLGTGRPDSLGRGSSVRAGAASDRDVFGAKTGIVANPNMNVGSNNGRGSGGSGTGDGNLSLEACLSRPEVQAYLSQVRDRTISRWTLPSGVSNSSATLAFRIDPAGSASRVEFQGTPSDPAAARSAIDALLAASPFPHMQPQVRCLANHNLIGTFSNTLVSN